MTCKHCGKELPESKGRRAKEYCSDACRQAHHRRKHQTEDREEMTTLQKELAKAQEQIAALEATVGKLHARVRQLEQHPRPERVQPVVLAEFANLHNVPASEYQRAVNVEALPLRSRKGVALLDEAGQRAFYQVFHELPSFVACPDCSHGYA